MTNHRELFNLYDRLALVQHDLAVTAEIALDYLEEVTGCGVDRLGYTLSTIESQHLPKLAEVCKSLREVYHQSRARDGEPTETVDPLDLPFDQVTAEQWIALSEEERDADS